MRFYKIRVHPSDANSVEHTQWLRLMGFYDYVSSTAHHTDVGMCIVIKTDLGCGGIGSSHVNRETIHSKLALGFFNRLKGFYLDSHIVYYNISPVTTMIVTIISLRNAYGSYIMFRNGKPPSSLSKRRVS
ncbi:MAG: hypothetical protein OXN17_02765 [Candidatus Poribacteria bacterium]|nr:hypothetical protein [Candidatus Poribacteria bacterium]MDE0506352.1 hypothetical protein [Candidatus Poribacteria bacterium]